MTGFPDMQVLLDDVLLKDDGAIFHWTLIGTNTGPVGTRRAVRITASKYGKLAANGLIADSQGRFDAVEYRRQLGAGSPLEPNETIKTR